MENIMLFEAEEDDNEINRRLIVIYSIVGIKIFILYWYLQEKIVVTSQFIMRFAEFRDALVLSQIFLRSNFSATVAENLFLLNKDNFNENI